MANEIRCPHCHTAFSIDEAEYADLIGQVRTAEFDKELHARLAEAEKAQRNEVALATAKVEQEAQQRVAQKEVEVQRLTAELKSADTARDLALAQEARKAQEAAAEKDAEILRLKADAREAVTAKELAIAKAVAAAQSEIIEVKAKLQVQESKQQAREAALKEAHSTEIKLKDEMIDRYKDMKARLTVKNLGESLEQHCEDEFNRYRAMGFFSNAEFGKDNDASGGTKGDYIFRDFSDDGVEFLSIMFEMKNESDLSTNKKKNTDFLGKLDKDRRAKGCEYAILVSMLEEESELYTGITDMSHVHEKMFVVRPQFFLTIITLLRTAARNTIAAKTELERAKQQNIDITLLDEEIQKFNTSFATAMGHAKTKYELAIAEIDKAIKSLQAVKEALRVSEGHWDKASNKTADISLKKLAKGKPTIEAMVAELKPAAADQN